MIDRMSAREYREKYVNQVVVFKDSPKKIKTNNPTEHEIQSAILDRLKFIKNGFFWRENSGQFFIGDGEKKRFFRAGITGIADIMGIYRGFAIAIEVKRPGKKPTLEQLAFKNKFTQCGGIYIVCSDSKIIMEQIDNELKT